MKILRVVLIIGFYLFAPPNVSEAKNNQKLSILTEEWPPISYEEDGKAQGFAVDVVKEIQAITNDEHTIQVVPWTRGYREVRTEPNVVLFTVIRTKEREKMFTLLGPLGYNEVALYGLEQKNLPVHSLEDAKKLMGIAANDDSLFDSTLRGVGFKNIVLTKDPVQEARLLAAGRVDLICNDFMVIEAALKKAGFGHLRLKRYLLIEKSQFYIAFSKGTSKDVIDRWKKALKQLKKDGSFQKISQKWLPKNEVPSEVEVVGIQGDWGK